MTKNSFFCDFGVKMKLILLLLQSSFFVICVFGKNTQRTREGRHWFRTYTETKVQKEIVTSLLPSSCVHVEATLPPCRNVRNLEQFPEFVGTQIYPEHIKGRQLAQPQNPDTIQSQQQIVLAPYNNASKSVGWAEYLGLVAPTVTVTAIELKTTTVVDPRTVVTFSVKGCRPSRLPLDLDRCPTSQYGVSIEEILPTSTVVHTVVQTAAPNVNQLSGNDISAKRAKNVIIEPSSSDLIVDELPLVPTEELSNVELTE